MVLKNSIKAIIIDRTKLLVAEKCVDGKMFYTLPGGGQETNELMLEALCREVKEETGYTVEPQSLLFIREGFSERTHRIEFMFVCNIIGEKSEPTDLDIGQVGTKWISIDNIMQEPLMPEELRGVIKNYFLGKKSPIYLGKMD